jgi:hypothetical protein
VPRMFHEWPQIVFNILKSCSWKCSKKQHVVESGLVEKEGFLLLQWTHNTKLPFICFLGSLID